MRDVKPAALVILDGYGIGENNGGNAVYLAKTPVMDELLKSCPHSRLSASSLDVGLPEGQMGNSEVGHTNIGAGRVVFQDLPRISSAVSDGSFFENKVYLKAMDDALKSGGSLHIMGLLSDGGVHSHIKHIFAALEMAAKHGLKKVFLHCFLDGRDTPPRSAAKYVSQLQDECRRIGVGEIATLQGRFWGMDRDKRWERLQKGYDAVVRGVGAAEDDPEEAVEKSYEAGVTDEFVEPVVLNREGVIKSGDSLIFMNFRPDRAREMTWALTGNLPADCPMDTDKLDLSYVCTTRYDPALDLPVAFPPEELRGIMGEYLSGLGIRQFRIAETEKYAHVTFFFNGGAEKQYPGEDRVLIPSPKEFPTYDLIPEMSAGKVCDTLCEKIAGREYGFYVCNFANCDMVGHTGVLAAAVKAVETVDECLGRVVEACRKNGVALLVTADHGNAECMLAPDGEPNTAHTTNPVPLVAVNTGAEKLSDGRLCDLAPTLLELMGLDKPPEMSGISLLA